MVPKMTSWELRTGTFGNKKKDSQAIAAHRRRRFLYEYILRLQFRAIRHSSHC